MRRARDPHELARIEVNGAQKELGSQWATGAIYEAMGPGTRGPHIEEARGQGPGGSGAAQGAMRPGAKMLGDKRTPKIIENPTQIFQTPTRTRAKRTPDHTESDLEMFRKCSEYEQQLSKK